MKLFPIAFFILLIQVAVLGRDNFVGVPIVTNYTMSEYKGGTQNWAIRQGIDGVMYFGNNKGILVFDGAEWQLVSLPNRTIVRSIAMGSDKKIYVGGQDELGYLRTAGSGMLVFHSMISKIPEAYRGFEDVWRIFLLGEKVIFCTKPALIIFDGDAVEILPAETQFEYFFQVDQTIFVQDNKNGLFEFKGGRLAPVAQGDFFSDKVIASVLPYSENQYLIVSYENGLFFLDDQGVTPWQTSSTQYLSTYKTFCATMLADSTYAIGTTQNGLILIDRQGQPVLHMNKSNGLQNNTVLNLFQDAHKNLWLGFDNGIDYVEISAPLSRLGSEMGVEGTGYASAYHNGNLYLGTNQGLYYTKWPSTDGPMVRESFQPVENGIGQVLSLDELSGTLIGGFHAGAFEISDGVANKISDKDGVWKFMELKKYPGYALEGTYTGINLLKLNVDSKGGKYPWDFVKKFEGFNESSRIMEEDNDGSIWVSHFYKGLFRIQFDDKLESIEKISLYNASNGLPSDISINVSKVRDEIIFTTPNGVYTYNDLTDNFEKYKQLNDLFGEDRDIGRIIEDETGNIWFSMEEEFGVLQLLSKGLFTKVDKLNFNHLQKELVDGFEDVHSYGEQNVFIGTNQGFMHYNPALKKDFSFPFPVLIRKIIAVSRVDSSAVDIMLAHTDQVGESTEKPEFPKKINGFRFGFAVPYYEQIGYVDYRYRLNGFEDQWSSWSGQTEKEYTNLPPGDYQFVVQARNPYGETSKSASYSFSVLPGWYETITAKLFYLLLLAMGIFFFARYHSKRLKKTTKTLQDEKTKELEAQEAEFREEFEKTEAQIIKLKNEKLIADINHKNKELASSAMHLVQKGEILLKVKQDLNRMLENANPDVKKKIKQIVRTIDHDTRLDDNWEQFEFHFDQVHENFMRRLRELYPALTPKDQKLCAYLRMNLSTKEIAPLMNISVRGVEISRYRLRKKLGLDSETNLVDFIINV